MRSLIRPFLKIAAWALTGAAVLALLALAGLMVFPTVVGWQGVVVLSGSMEPTLKTGGIAFVEPVDTSTIKAGDVITYTHPERANSQITHRVVEVFEESGFLRFRTKGDANTDIDQEPVPESAVVGKVQLTVPYVGRLVQSLRDRETYYIFVGIPASLLILSELYNIGKELTGRAKRKEAEDEMQITTGGPA